MWTFLKQRWQDVLAVLILGLTVYLYMYAPDKVDSLDKPSPALASLPLIDGRPLPTEAVEGRVLLVNFWATWCGFCRRELPSLQELQQELGPQGLTVVALSVDDEASLVSKYLLENPLTLHVGMAPRAVVRAFGGANALPTTYVVDREGNIKHKIEGWVRKGVLENLVRPYLSVAASPSPVRSSASNRSTAQAAALPPR